jgi:hypothetical protein
MPQLSLRKFMLAAVLSLSTLVSVPAGYAQTAPLPKAATGPTLPPPPWCGFTGPTLPPAPWDGIV